MRFTASSLSGCVCALMLVFAVPGPAAEMRKCTCQAVTPASYTWDFPAEANTIFQAIQSDAQKALDTADKMSTYAADTADPDWTIQGIQLGIIRGEVNDMGARLCRLSTIRRVVKPWQQKEIDRVTADILLMADNIQDAIVFLNAHEGELWLPAYEHYASNIYFNAHDLARSVDKAVQYVRLSREYRNLGHGLGARAAS